MGEILTFAPRPKPAAAPAPEPLSDLDIRARVEAAAEVAVDTAQQLIALLDRMDGDPDLEDGGDAEPSLAAPESPGGSQVAWMRGGDQDREGGAPEIVLPEVMATAVPHLRWGGRGNVVAAAGVMLVELLERA